MTRYLFTLLIILNSVISNVGAQNREGLSVEIAPVHKEKKSEQINAVGTLLPFEEVTLKPEISGKIIAIDFKEGTSVKKSVPLIRFDQRTAAASVKEAKAKLLNARQNVNRLNAAKGSSSAQQLDSAKTEVLLAEAALETAEAGLAKMTLSAPFSGVMGLRNFEVGDYIQAGTALVTIVNANRLKLEFNLPERIAHTIKVGQSVEFTVDNFPTQIFRGEIYTISPEIERSGRSLVVRALYDNKDNQLISGMFVRLSLKIPLGYDVIIAPEEAVFALEGRPYVYRVIEDGNVLRAKLTEVEIGDRSTFSVEILAGITADDRIVKAGQARISDGMIVTDIALSKEEG